MSLGIDCDSASTTEEGESSTSREIVHGARYFQHSVFGCVFELPSKYDVLDPIGRGAYGFVCSAYNSETKEKVAIKKLSNAFISRIDAKKTFREIKLLSCMDHENVISIKDVVRPPEKEKFKDVYIVYELMDSDLHQIIQSRQPLTEDHYQYFLYQILRGLKYIHSANVLHFDLKPSNLLVNGNSDLKIADFGLARTVSETVFMTEYVVTQWYRAPEMILGCNKYSAAIDVWAVGCIFAEILTGKPLFPAKDYAHQLQIILELIGSPDEASMDFLSNENAKKHLRDVYHRGQSFSFKFPELNPQAVDLLEKMLLFDPRKRITVQEAICHPYLSILHDESDEPLSSHPFTFNFENQYLSEDELKELVWRESLKFNPDPTCDIRQQSIQ